MTITSVGVLGAGTMGAQIALHLANAGVPVLLLDVTRDAGGRGAAAGAQAQARSVVHARHLAPRQDRRLRQRTSACWRPPTGSSRPSSNGSTSSATLITRVAAACRGDAVVSTNTSGIPVGAIAEGRPLERRRHWLGTHFFNPPRYLRAARDRADARHRSGGGRPNGRVRRPRARQGRRRGEGHAELHRQPHRPATASPRSCARWTTAAIRSTRSTR